MSNPPPVPPRPTYDGFVPPPPPLPPLVGPPRFENPLIAPRPHRVDRHILEEIDRPATPTPASLTCSLPSLSLLQSALPQIVNPSHDPNLRIAWCRDVFFLFQRTIPSGYPYTDPPIGPVSLDPVLKSLSETAVALVIQIASSAPLSSSKLPLYAAEAVALRAFLQATGAFPSFIPQNPRAAFRDYETAGRNGFASAWFRLGRDYENFNDHQHARECFERGVKMGVESCLYRLGMAHLLGQLSLPSNPSLALPLLHRAALLSSLACPQPAYVYSLLLLSEFTLPDLPPSLLHPSIFSPFIPPNSSPHLEARKHLERAAFLHFAPAQYKLGHAYEFADPPFPFDPILSVQYYSLASQQGEPDADMALSKWFLCGSGGAASNTSSSASFEKDESLALHFASKATSKNLPSALFAMGYYAEVGVGQPKSVTTAREWYRRAVLSGNEDATERLRALDALVPSTLTSPQSGPISREEHERLTEFRLVRRRTNAMQRMANEPISPPWQGTVFPTLQEQHPISTYTQREGKNILDVIRKNSLSEGAPSGSRSESPRAPPPQPASAIQTKPRYPWGDRVAPPIISSISSPSSRNTSPNRPVTFPSSNSNNSNAEVPIGRKSNNRTPPPPVGGRENGRGRSESPAPGKADWKAGKSRPSDIPIPPITTNTSPSTNATPTSNTMPGSGRTAQTFAEMGIVGAKAEDKDCVIM